MNKKAFSLVEIIIVISLIVLLSVIWVSVNSQFQEKSKNTKISSDLETLKNSLTQYKQEIKTLPFPWGNINFFTTHWLYSHDETNAFWVYGAIEEQTIEKKYMSFHPLDPRTNQYYAYGKTIKDNFFEVAGVLKEDGKYTSKVLGDYSGEWWPYNLIRDYNGPDFVEDGSTLHFPYNPEERIITAHISSYSWAITINNELKTSSWEILNFTFKEWDRLKISSWWYANIYYSDGSTSILWDNMRETELSFASMQYPQENNLITKIKLALKTGTIWTKAAKMWKDSEFSIYTTDSTAAVRGTIFWVQKIETWETNITVEIGKVDIKQNYGVYDFEKLSEQVTSGNIYQNPLPNSPALLDIDRLTNGESMVIESYIEVLPWGNSEWVNIHYWTINNETIDSNFQAEINITPFLEATNTIPCPYSFSLEWECVYNSLASKWWSLVGYAPFEKDSTFYYKNGSWDLISTGWTQSGSIIFQNGGVLVGTWQSLKYNISDLSLSDNFAIEVEVKGEDLKHISTLTSTPPIWYIYFSTYFSTYIQKETTNAIRYKTTYFKSGGWDSISENNININTLMSDKYYSLLSIVEKENVAILRDNEIKDKKSNRAIHPLSEIFIGTDNSWNKKFWTIYSLKIYKK